MSFAPEEKKALDKVIRKMGYTDYKWIDPKKIITAQWVRMKCMFGCNGYGNCAACPPNTPSLEVCERFFNEYEDTTVRQFDFSINVRTEYDQKMDRYAFLMVK